MHTQTRSRWTTRLLVVLTFSLLVLAAVTATTSTAAGSGLTVIGSSSAPSRGSARSHTSAQASKTDAHLVYFRVYGHRLTYRWKMHCVNSPGMTRWGKNGTTTYTPYSRSIASGQLHRISVGNPYAPASFSMGDCTITASASGRGRIRLQILAA